jgi:predicted alpha/beta hydrolase
MQHLGPDEIGAPAIGHFGFFRKRFESALWPRVGNWLDRQVVSHH